MRAFLRVVPWRGVAALVLVLVAVGVTAAIAPVRAVQRPDVSAALLRVEDLPAGWTAVESSDFGEDGLGLDEPESLSLEGLGIDPTGPCAAALAPFIDAIAANPPAIDMVQFQRGTLGPFIAHTVIVAPPGLLDTLTTLFESETIFELSSACQQEVEQAGGDDLPFDFADLGLTIEATPLDLPAFGEESIAIRLDVTLGFIGTSLLGAFSIHGDAISLLFMLADPITATESIDLFGDLAVRADSRLSDLVAGR